MHSFGRTWWRYGDGTPELRPTLVSEAGCCTTTFREGRRAAARGRQRRQHDRSGAPRWRGRRRRRGNGPSHPSSERSTRRVGARVLRRHQSLPLPRRGRAHRLCEGATWTWARGVRRASLRGYAVPRQCRRPSSRGSVNPLEGARGPRRAARRSEKIEDHRRSGHRRHPRGPRDVGIPARPPGVAQRSGHSPSPARRAAGRHPRALGRTQGSLRHEFEAGGPPSHGRRWSSTATTSPRPRSRHTSTSFGRRGERPAETISRCRWRRGEPRMLGSPRRGRAGPPARRVFASTWTMSSSPHAKRAVGSTGPSSRRSAPSTSRSLRCQRRRR